MAKEIKDKIPNSFTVYGEIVGYKPEGGAIQVAAGGKSYDYGCAQGEHKFAVYRVKSTNIDGKTLELSWPQMREFCNKYGLTMVHEWFYGPVLTICPYNPLEETIEIWQKKLLETLKFLYVRDDLCKFNKNAVPAEGVVLRVDYLERCESYKLKNFRFLQDETKNNDAGIIDTETLESE